MEEAMKEKKEPKKESVKYEKKEGLAMNKRELKAGTEKNVKNALKAFPQLKKLKKK